MNILLFLFVGVCIGQKLSLHDKIIKGYVAKIGQFPYQVSLRRGNFHFCGGSIIDETTILTAAHCVVKNGKITNDNIDVVVGTNSLTRGGTYYRVRKIIPHERFVEQLIAGKILNDIALLKINGKISFSNLVKPIALGERFTPNGLNGIVSGWGAEDRVFKKLPTFLKFAHLETLSDAECKRRIQVTHNGLCSVERSGISYKGDSGGPFVVNHKLVGVVSFGVPNTDVDVYTRVSTHISWINYHRMQ